MSGSRIAWFLGSFLLTLPILLAAFKEGEDITQRALLLSLGSAAALGVVMALLWGKGS